MRKRSRSLWLGTLLLLLPCSALSYQYQSPGRVHTRVGPMVTSYTGPISNSYSVPATFDFEYEHFVSPTFSYAARSIFAYDFSAARLMYGYAGLGMRRYIYSTGMSFDSSNEGAKISIQPRFQYYIGGDAGISQVVVKTHGTVLQTNSALMDFSACGGAIYKAWRAFGLEAQLGYSMGFGFSSVAVSESHLRFFMGATWNL
ncbi:MAG: hypothetical protein A2X94_00415 [Bdellovibrionales bacterium GWB1_55_8]|nr:MAG: hypothetical protein A2X94_00415 [Bdellovibrionales bacterium GWB1_55_8]